MAALQTLAYGATDVALASRAHDLPWITVLTIPIIGGLIVGLLLHVFDDDGRASSVADVIAASRLRAGRISLKDGVISATVSALSLGLGASAGREGPVVHLAGALASRLSRWLRSPAVEARTLLGCAVAAAVSASFNAPIAGALFALEVVLGHYAVRAFAPIVIASVAGAVVSRRHFGEAATFTIPHHALSSFWELPAFALLGLVCAVAATVFMGFIILADDWATKRHDRLRLPVWLDPVIGGAMLGMIAIAFPEIIGVGYETTNRALHEGLNAWSMIWIAIAKMIAVAVTLASRFGGGVFSPSLMLGALVGGVFGTVATGLAPGMVGEGAYGLYALAGMGAVSAAMLGAPISTTLIVFELTGNYQTAIAVMVAVSVASVVTQQMIERSYFHWRLGRKGLHLGDGPQRYLLETMTVSSVMRPRGGEDSPSETMAWDLVEQNVHLEEADKLSRALAMFEHGKLSFIPVVKRTEGGGRTLIGAVVHTDALRAYNRALVQAHEEEHG